MHVLIDYTAGIAQEAGIGQYTRCLVDELLQCDQDDQFSLFSAERPTRLRGFPEGPRVRAITGPLDNRRMTLLWHRLRVPLPVQWLTGGCDVFHAPDFSLPPLYRTPSVVTVHDLAFITHPECLLPGVRDHLMRVTPSAIRRATRIIAASQRTADDLVTLLGAPPEKIRVIHLGVGASMRRVEDVTTLDVVQRRYGLRHPYVLAVGTIQPRKNYVRLIEAFARVCGQREAPAQLVIAGQKGWLYEDIFETARRVQLGNRLAFLDYVPATDLPAIYSMAAAVVTPSLYEGFGLPPLEAMACGVPAIVSDGGSLPEVVSDAGIVIPALDVAALSDALMRVMSDQTLRSDMIKRGLIRARSFTWAVAAERHLSVYREASQLE